MLSKIKIILVMFFMVVNTVLLSSYSISNAYYMEGEWDWDCKGKPITESVVMSIPEIGILSGFFSDSGNMLCDCGDCFFEDDTGDDGLCNTYEGKPPDIFCAWCEDYWHDPILQSFCFGYIYPQRCNPLP